MMDVSSDDGRTTDAAQELQQFRERMLRWMLVVSLVCYVPVTALLLPRGLRAHNYTYVVFNALSVVDLVAIAVLRGLPLSVRAWAFTLPSLAHVALLLPAYVDPVGLANAAASCMFLAALCGAWSGGLYGALLVAVLLVAQGIWPGEVDPVRLQGIRMGPLEPLVILIGTIPLVTMGIAAVHTVLRGLVRGYGQALSHLSVAEQNDRRFRGVFELTPDPMALLRLPEGRYEDVNPAFEAAFGWPRADVLGRTGEDLQLFRAEDRARVLRRLVHGHALDALEVTAQRRDGRELRVVLDARAADMGGQRMAVIVARDVTQQRRLESVVRHAQQVEAIGQLTGGIAHNFRNVLGTILPNLDVCLEAASDELKPALQDARTAASAAVGLAERLTRIARREAVTTPGPVAVGPLLAEVVALCRSTFEARHALVLDAAGDGVVNADRGELHQVFLNLLLNARDAVEDLTLPRIYVRLRRSEDGQSLLASVTDNGAGMDELTLRRLGEPFFTTKGADHGTGLGLTTAFAAVRAAGGRITVESRSGAGSSFTVQLPLAEVGAVQAAPSPRLGGRALVVEDDRLLLDALGRQLGQLGIEAELVSDGPVAAARLREAPGAFNLLITDLEMPGVGGRQLIAEAQASEPGLPVLVITGANAPEPIPGVAAVLSKPVPSAQLEAAVARCLGLEGNREGVERSDVARSGPSDRGDETCTS
jgi:PAS domain S-box-containing protein